MNRASGIRRIGGGPGLPASFPFSLAAVVGRTCFISGMPALDAEGKYQEGSFEEEADLAWRNVVAIAQASGFDEGDVVFVQCALADIGHYGDLNAWWRARFPDVAQAPARFTYQAGALPFGAKVEFQAVAARDE